jgi:hypothetical protein
MEWDRSSVRPRAANLFTAISHGRIVVRAISQERAKAPTAQANYRRVHAVGRRFDRNVVRGNTAPLCASYMRCGAIGTVHIESASASEKTCARFAIPGSSQNTLETPDSFARGATGRCASDFNRRREWRRRWSGRARRRAFASMHIVEKSGRRRVPAMTEACACWRLVGPRDCDRHTGVVVAARVGQFRK